MAIAKNTICLWYDKDAEAAARFYRGPADLVVVGKAPGSTSRGRSRRSRLFISDPRCAPVSLTAALGPGGTLYRLEADEATRAGCGGLSAVLRGRPPLARSRSADRRVAIGSQQRMDSEIAEAGSAARRGVSIRITSRLASRASSHRYCRGEGRTRGLHEAQRDPHTGGARLADLVSSSLRRSRLLSPWTGLPSVSIWLTSPMMVVNTAFPNGGRHGSFDAATYCS
jgi:hypothetical protein